MLVSTSYIFKNKTTNLVEFFTSYCSGGFVGFTKTGRVAEEQQQGKNEVNLQKAYILGFMLA